MFQMIVNIISIISLAVFLIAEIWSKLSKIMKPPG